MELKTIYLIYLISISIFSSLIYIMYKYFEFKNEANFYWSELIIDIFIFFMGLYIAKIFFGDEKILGMNWWVSYLVIPTIISAIPMIIHFKYFPYVFWNERIFFELDTGNYKKAIELLETKKEYIDENEQINISISIAIQTIQNGKYDIADWLDTFWWSQKWEELIKKWEEKIKIAISLFENIIDKDTDKEVDKWIWFWYSNLWDYKKANEYLKQSLNSNMWLTYKFKIVTQILKNNLNLKELEKSQILIDEYYKKLPTENLWNWEDYFLVNFLLMANNTFRDLWKNKDALIMLEKAIEFENDDEQINFIKWEIEILKNK